MQALIQRAAFCRARYMPRISTQALLGALCVYGSAMPSSHAAQPLTLAPTVITSAAPEQSPLVIDLDPRQPRQPMPASDAAEYLETIPGFSAIRSGGVNSDPVLRGMMGSRLKMLTNGSEIIGACPARMDSASSYISPESFTNLRVIKGPQSVRWGAGASAGTVLFDRGPESFEDADSRLSGSVVGGSYGRSDQHLDGALGNEQGYLRMLGNRSKSNDYKDGNGDRVPSRWRKWDSEVAVGWTPDADTWLELSAGRGDGEARYAGRGMDGSQFKRESYNLRFSKMGMGEVFQGVEGQVYYNYADHVMDNYSLRQPSGMAMAMDVDRRTLGARFNGVWRTADWELIAGADGQRSIHRGRMGMGRNTYKNERWERDANFTQYGLFAEYTQNLASNSQWISGARVDQACAKDSRHADHHSRCSDLYSGFTRYEYDLSSDARAYVGIGHAQRFPDYWELFSGGEHAFAQIAPEKTTQLDVGFNYQKEALNLWWSGYAGYVQDYILFRETEDHSGHGGGHGHGGKQNTAMNVDALIAGSELGAGYQLSERWRTENSLAWAWGENRTNHRALPQMPPLEARLALTYEHDNWSAGALWRLVAKQTRTAMGDGNVVGRDLEKSHGFAVLSLNGAYRLTEQVRVSSGIDNVLNKTYSEHLNLAGNGGFGFPGDRSFNEAGRIFWGRMDFSF